MKKPISAVKSFETWGRSSEHYDNCKKIDEYVAHLESVIKSATLTDEEIEINYPSYLKHLKNKKAMAKTEITVNIPIEEVWSMIKEKYNVDDTAECKPIIKTVWKGDQRDGYNEHTLMSLQIKYDG